jgi:hypothetical protein
LFPQSSSWPPWGVCLPLVGAGWLTGLRGAFHGMVLVLSVAAFLPLLVVLTFILLFLVVSLLAVLVGESDAAPAAADAFAASEGLANFRRRILVPYYRVLFAQRHPALLGAACGLLLGTLLIGMLLSLLVVPGEVCTLKRMAAVQGALQKQIGWLHGPPAPVQGRWADAALLPGTPPGWPYCAAASTEPAESTSLLLDGFGRRLTYEVSGRWPLASYSISSLGYDGRPSGDDLCISGNTLARSTLDRLKDTAKLVHDLLAGPSGQAATHHWWSAVRATSCPAGTRRTY